MRSVEKRQREYDLAAVGTTPYQVALVLAFHYFRVFNQVRRPPVSQYGTAR